MCKDEDFEHLGSMWIWQHKPIPEISARGTKNSILFEKNKNDLIQFFFIIVYYDHQVIWPDG